VKENKYLKALNRIQSGLPEKSVKAWVIIHLKRLQIYSGCVLEQIFAPLVFMLTVAFIAGLGVLHNIDANLRGIVVYSAVLWLAAAIIFAIRDTPYPSKAQAISGLDRLSANTLFTLLDKPLQANELGSRIWGKAVDGARLSLKKLPIPGPLAALSGIDKYSTLTLMALAFGVTFILQGDKTSANIQRAFSLQPPDYHQSASATSITALIIPPEYTGLKEQFIKAAEGGSIGGNIGENNIEKTIVPEGSRMEVKLSKSIIKPWLQGCGSVYFKRGDGAIEDATEDDLYQARFTVKQGCEPKVSILGFPLARFPIEVKPDLPPLVAIVNPPKTTPEKRVAIEYTASDEYAIKSVTATITENYALTKAIQSSPPLVIKLDTAGQATPSFREISIHNLAYSHLAGREVTITLQAEDVSGQLTESEAVDFRLPEALFENPLSQILQSYRKQLQAYNINEMEAVRTIVGAANNDKAIISGDIIANLALRSGITRLMLIDRDNGSDLGAYTDTAALFWDIAVYLEKYSGNGRNIENYQAMLDAMEGIMRAMESGDMQAAERAINQLNRALNQSLRQAMEQAQKNMDSSGIAEDLARLNLQQSMALSDYMQKIQELFKTGSREQAMQMIKDLQRGIKNAMANPMSEAEMQEIAEQIKAISELEKITNRQEKALNATFAKLNNDEQANESDSTEQLEIKNQLGKLMKSNNGESAIPPDAMEKLESSAVAMENATRELANKMLQPALSEQAEALDLLKQAADGAKKNLAEKLSGQMSLTFGSSMSPLQRFGNNGRGAFSHSGIEIPGESEIQRSRQILEELYRRTNEKNRTQQERDYLNRLIEMDD
jgi:RNA polymerase-interacting CarD/CdnL/TRCF family regulator